MSDSIQLFNPSELLAKTYVEQWRNVFEALKKTEREMRQYGIEIPEPGPLTEIAGLKPLVDTGKNESTPERDSDDGEKLIDRVRAACHHIEEGISKPVVIQWLEDNGLPYKAPSVASSLIRMRKEGELIEVQQGGPGKAAVYALADQEKGLASLIAENLEK